MAPSGDHFFTKEALLDRLTDGVRRTKRPVVFLVGSALATPVGEGHPGVPSVSGVIDLIRDEFSGERLLELDAILSSSQNRYQDAFSFLLSRRGQNIVNDTIKKAVWSARKASHVGSQYHPTADTDDDLCRAFDADFHAWALPPAAQALGELVANNPTLFGQYALTTNFDPLIEAAISTAGGSFYRTVLHRDGDIGQTEASGCHVVHLHGYWYGTETLHTPRQLNQERPRLRASLSHVIRSKTLVVCGYGGWSDVFTSTLLELIQDDREHCEIVWCFYGSGNSAPPELLKRLGPGIDRGVVTLYEGIDCHSFLPELASAWRKEEQSAETSNPSVDSVAQNSDTNFAHQPPNSAAGPLIFDAKDQDRPPLIEYYVGRGEEAEILDSTEARIIYLTGIGGQGKSALAANYLTRHLRDNSFDYVVWRDCKEEAERFDSQIVSINYALLAGSISKSELTSLDTDRLIDLFITSSKNYRLLLVFDNVDHYVDLERNRLVGAAAIFVEKLLASKNPTRAIFTCRPSIGTVDAGSLEVRLKGLDLASAKELFRLRQVTASDEDIQRAHSLTSGHAFWLDLIAAQISRSPQGLELEEILNSMPSGAVGLPVETLQSIWNGLKEREHLVLRGLAEAVRPITANQLADYLAGHLRWNQLAKAIKYLRGLNLIVVKLHEGRNELLELHPLVRAFVRQSFKPAEQKSIVEAILRSYLAFFGIHRVELSRRARPETIDRWLEAAEVCTQAGRIEQAFEWLNDVRRHVQRTGQALNFVRIADALARSNSWDGNALPKHFDDVFDFLIECVSNMGRDHQAQSLLEIYKDSIPHKNARYINYCNLMCYYYWVNDDFLTAIKWGVEGKELKLTSGVDTEFDTGHNLALAQRDSGAVDAALKHFLLGKKLDQIVAPGKPDVSLGGAFYGNVGRCLQFMGQIDHTLSCYRKSATVIEGEITEASVSNKGYVRLWVGEVFYAKGDMRLASACFSAAIGCWETISPPRADSVQRRFNDKDGYSGLSAIDAGAAEQIFLKWVRDA